MTRLLPLFALGALTACGEDVENPGGENEEEVITTVTLTFTPSGGSAMDFTWADPENDGSPVIDDVVLSDADDYTLGVRFLNELEDPPEEITEEVHAESDVHQLFFTGTAVESPATGTNPSAVVTQSYDDQDVNGIPIGLESSIVTLATGSGTFIVTLRHLADEASGAVLKTPGLADEVASGGFESIPGATDAQVTFDLTVE